MNFCPKCNARMEVVRRKESNRSVVGLSCRSCGFFKEAEEMKVKETTEGTGMAIKVVDKRAENLRSMPTTPAICPKCGSDTAYFWSGQTSSLEKASPQFFRCTHCSHTWRSS